MAKRSEVMRNLVLIASLILRDGVNNRFNKIIKSRLAIGTMPMIVSMQYLHYHALSGYLLRGGSSGM
ncbi:MULTISPECIES: hypothetical protein [unclassified Klebsiella]|uniref:hypothetical protein n=1 Tax=unclassified Klebsiella TaxID=2608929 RepID=UPI00197FF484|nr:MULTISPECIES: hypothetical protein [unclassified Klebsiella]